MLVESSFTPSKCVFCVHLVALSFALLLLRYYLHVFAYPLLFGGLVSNIQWKWKGKSVVSVVLSLFHGV